MHPKRAGGDEMFEGYVFVEKNGAPAKDRFTDAKAVRAVYQKLSEDDFKESQRRLRIRRLYDGNLPYNPDDLKACGLKDLTNVNFLGLKGTIDNRADAILKLQSDTANLVELRPIARELAGPDASRISDVVAEEFSSMLREGGRFVPALAMMNKEADLYGLGPITWPNDLDYAPVALERKVNDRHCLRVVLVLNHQNAIDLLALHELVLVRRNDEVELGALLG